jgi:hypothetical protein
MTAWKVAVVLALLFTGASLSAADDGWQARESAEAQRDKEAAGSGELSEAEWAAVLRVIRERDADLAEELERALERIREDDGDERLEVTMRFLAELLERADQRRHRGHARRPPFGEPGGRAPRHPAPPGFGRGPRFAPPGPHHPPPPPNFEMERRLQELHERHERLERESQELAERFRSEKHGDGEAETRDRLRTELERVINEHFEVRTQLRQLELERLERELRMLERELERMRRQFEQRERERGVIIERRLRQLLGKDFGGW